LCAPLRRPERNRSAPHVPLEGDHPVWRVWRAPGRRHVGPPSVPELQEKGAQQPPSGECWLLGTISWQTYKTAQKPCIFNYHLIHDVSPKFQTFQKIHNVWQLFFAELLWGIRRSEVVPCGDRAAAYIVGAASIQAPAGDRWEKPKPSGRRKWP
jgi:hypothetical protein